MNLMSHLKDLELVIRKRKGVVYSTYGFIWDYSGDYGIDQYIEHNELDMADDIDDYGYFIFNAVTIGKRVIEVRLLDFYEDDVPVVVFQIVERNKDTDAERVIGRDRYVIYDGDELREFEEILVKAWQSAFLVVTA